MTVLFVFLAALYLLFLGIPASDPPLAIARPLLLISIVVFLAGPLFALRRPGKTGVVFVVFFFYGLVGSLPLCGFYTNVIAAPNQTSMEFVACWCAVSGLLVATLGALWAHLNGRATYLL